jgi:hypothetical protein
MQTLPDVHNLKTGHSGFRNFQKVEKNNNNFETRRIFPCGNGRAFVGRILLGDCTQVFTRPHIQ